MKLNQSADDRLRLELDTAAYFHGLSNAAAEEESHLGHALSQCADEIDFVEIESPTKTDPAV